MARATLVTANIGGFLYLAILRKLCVPYSNS